MSAHLVIPTNASSQVRILVTHSLTHLPQCDMIVVMDEGRIVEQGSYSELIENDCTFANFLHTYANVESEGKLLK